MSSHLLSLQRFSKGFKSSRATLGHSCVALAVSLLLLAGDAFSHSEIISHHHAVEQVVFEDIFTLCAMVSTAEKEWYWASKQ